MSIDTDEMVRMAKERKGWQEHEVGGYICNENGTTIIDCYDDTDAQFILNAIRVLPLLSERVATLEAQNAALQARVDALGEWQGVEIYPPYAGHWATQPVHPILMVGWGRKNAQGEWENGFGGHPPNEVIGWRPLPDESPTAAV